MAIYLDDQAVRLSGGDLGSVLASAQDRLDAVGRVVVEVQVDGQTLGSDQLDGARDQAVDGRELRLYSAEPRELAVQTLDQVHGVLALAREQQEQAAELLQEDRPGDAMKAVGRAIDGWLQTQQAVLHSAVLVGVDLDELDVDGRAVSAITEDLLGQLTVLKQLIEANDTVGLADTLAYEWAETTDQWDRLVSVLSEHLAPGK